MKNIYYVQMKSGQRLVVPAKSERQALDNYQAWCRIHRRVETAETVVKWEQ